MDDIHSKLNKVHNTAVENLTKLKEIVVISNSKQIDARFDELFTPDNVNYFTNLYILTTCSYVESFLKETLWCIVEEFSIRVASSNISHHFMYWYLSNKEINDEYEIPFKNFQIPISRDDKKLKALTEISANVQRTIESFKNIGIDLNKDENFRDEVDKQNFQDKKRIISSIVTQRNNIIHHATYNSIHISLHDVANHIDESIKYIEIISNIVKKHYP